MIPGQFVALRETPTIDAISATVQFPAGGSVTMITLTLPEPPSANRWWRNVNGRMVTSKAARDYKATVAGRCLVQGVKPIAAPTPVCVVIEWDRQRKSGDLDKRLGVLLDALQGNCYDNDAQITRIVAERRDGGSGSVQVTVVSTGASYE